MRPKYWAVRVVARVLRTVRDLECSYFWLKNCSVRDKSVRTFGQNIAQYATYVVFVLLAKALRSTWLTSCSYFWPKNCAVRDLHRVRTFGQRIAQFVTSCSYFWPKYCAVRDLHRVRTFGQRIAQFVTYLVFVILAKILRSTWLHRVCTFGQRIPKNRDVSHHVPRIFLSRAHSLLHSCPVLFFIYLSLYLPHSSLPFFFSRRLLNILYAVRSSVKPW